MHAPVRVLGALAAFSLLFSGSAVASAHAPKPPLPKPPGQAKSRAKSDAAGVVGAPAKAKLRRIVCTPRVHNPHKSHHVPGTVNVVATVQCTAPVPLIAIRTALYRNGRLVKDSGQKNVRNAAKASNNAAEKCHSAAYRGWMAYHVRFPAGYRPPSGGSSGFGAEVRIAC
ncbi:hypothetical protein [Bailinhaonella thermotolerans]|uniref:Secreted protein n=1 Tax=Bailinhaonella thermotolerans TaxID=1070861 RepID=A0A3A4AU09_9ACTN|nr:hypothetical protein [Bailinhaonella thermotolerans]RJL31785.1 hypothetical protein D5H75_19020 [Bailinhaonella thermotolerans]